MKIFLVLTTVLLSLNTYSFSNPLRRDCLQKNGEFIVAPIENDQVALCKIGSSYIGALDLVYLNSNQPSESLLNYAHRKLSCAGKEIQTVVNEFGVFKLMCLHEDGSLMDVQSLTLGRDSSMNSALNSALGL